MSGEGVDLHRFARRVHSEAGLDQSVENENRPELGGPRCCRACLFHPFETAIAPPAGTPVRIGGEYTRNELRIWREDLQSAAAGAFG